MRSCGCGYSCCCLSSQYFSAVALGGGGSSFLSILLRFLLLQIYITSSSFLGVVVRSLGAVVGRVGLLSVL